MRKFLKYIFALLLVSVFLLYLVDFIYTYTYLHGTPRNKVSYLLSIENQKIDYVFIGSSRVDNGIDADIIESITGKRAINLGVQAGKIDDFLLMLELLKTQNITAETVFIQVDYIYNIEGNSEILMSSLMPFIHNDVIYTYIKERDPRHWAFKYLPFYRYLMYDYKIGFREFFITSIGRKPRIELQNGYSPIYGNKAGKMNIILPDHILDENPSINAINSFAEKNNLKTIYFIAPFCSCTKNLEYVSKLREKVPQFWDFSSVFKKEDYFYDCSHLNDKGAKEFSKIFAEKIKANLTTTPSLK